MAYFDNNSTTIVNKEVVAVISDALERLYGNASSSYKIGKTVKRVLEKSRKSIGDNLHIKTPSEQLFFTSSATESNNIAIRGRVSKFLPDMIPHVITTQVEHSAVYETIKDLQRCNLCVATFLKVDKNGLFDINDLKESINENTVLVSVIVGNNEIGSIQDIREVVEACKSFPKVHVHADITQMVGKYDIDLSMMEVDSACFSAHKFQGPKGIGGLFLKNKDNIKTCITGGLQESGVRAGTENIPYILGMDVALQLSLTNLVEKQQRVTRLRDWIQTALLEAIPNAIVNANIPNRLYNTLSISVPSCNSRSILAELDKLNVYVNVGSACNKDKRSRVLEAIGLPIEYEQGTFRISLSHNTTEQECNLLVSSLQRVIQLA